MHNKTILPRGAGGTGGPTAQLTRSVELYLMGDGRGMQRTRPPEKQMMTTMAAAVERGRPNGTAAAANTRPPLVATCRSSRDIWDKKRMCCTPESAPRSPDAAEGARCDGRTAAIEGGAAIAITHRERISIIGSRFNVEDCSYRTQGS